MSRGKQTKNNYLHKAILISFLLIVSFVSIQMYISFSPSRKILVKKVEAAATTLTVTSCDLNDVANSACYTAISTDGGTEASFTKNQHIDAPFQTLDAAAITSATLYYDARGTLSGSWGVYVKDARDGNTLCSVDPAPENSSETRNSLSCSITTTQLANGVWYYAVNNDGSGPEDIYLDYVYLSVDYTPNISISITTDGSVDFGNLDENTTEDTTSSGINDVETISVDTGPVDLDVRASSFTDGSNPWTFASSTGTQDEVKFEFSKDGSAWSTILLADTLYTLDTNVAQSATRDLYLRITTPSSTSSFDPYNSTVTVVASAP
jgi:hypothetical protein